MFKTLKYFSRSVKKIDWIFRQLFSNIEFHYPALLSVISSEFGWISAENDTWTNNIPKKVVLVVEKYFKKETNNIL